MHGLTQGGNIGGGLIALQFRLGALPVVAALEGAGELVLEIGAPLAEARLRRCENLVRDRDLMWLHVNAAGEERAQRVRASLEIEPHRLGAQLKILGRAPSTRRELLGGPTRGRVRVYAHAATPEQMKTMQARGFTAFKTGPAKRRPARSSRTCR